MPKNADYRKLALESYAHLCACCGFGLQAVLQVAHLDQNRENNAIANLAIMCPTCHRMHDLNIITTQTVRQMRSRMQRVEFVVTWKLLVKDAGPKAAAARKRNREQATSE